MLQDLAYTIVYTQDMESAAHFYQEQLGLSLSFTAPGWTEFKTGGATLVLHPQLSGERAKHQQGSRVHMSFRVVDLDKEYRELVARGVTFIAPPATAGFGKHATCLDPEGNCIDLLEWAAPRPVAITSETLVNDFINTRPETMEVMENHGIRICGGCIVLLNSPVMQTAEYSGLAPDETSALIAELNDIVLTASAAA